MVGKRVRSATAPQYRDGIAERLAALDILPEPTTGESLSGATWLKPLGQFLEGVEKGYTPGLSRFHNAMIDDAMLRRWGGDDGVFVTFLDVATRYLMVASRYAEGSTPADITSARSSYVLGLRVSLGMQMSETEIAAWTPPERWVGGAARLRFQQMVDTRRQDFTHIDFRDVPRDLLARALHDSPALFVGADLTEAELSGVHLPGVDMSGAILYRARFQGADLSQARLRSADLRRVDGTGANLRKADLCEAKLQYARLRRADLGAADLRNAKLQRAQFDQAYLMWAKLDGAKLADADFNKAYLKYARLSGVRGWRTNFALADLNCADLTGAELSGADFSQAYLRGAILTAAMLQHADFEGADLLHVKSTEADFTNAKFQRCNMWRSDFANATMADARGLPRDT